MCRCLTTSIGWNKLLPVTHQPNTTKTKFVTLINAPNLSNSNSAIRVYNKYIGSVSFRIFLCISRTSTVISKLLVLNRHKKSYQITKDCKGSESYWNHNLDFVIKCYVTPMVNCSVLFSYRALNAFGTIGMFT